MSQTVVALVAAVAGESAREAAPRRARYSPMAATFTTVVQRHRGREVSGGGLGAAFGNVRDAIACALEVQAGGDRPTGAPDLRIALHAGEVVEEDGRLVGEAIVTAACLVGAVDAQQVWCSGAVRELALGVPGVEFVLLVMVAADPLDPRLAVYRVERASSTVG